MNGIQIARQLRRQAEQTQDPLLYDQAALAFDKLGMPSAAEGCRRRASHYAGQGKPVTVEYQIPEKVVS